MKEKCVSSEEGPQDTINVVNIEIINDFDVKEELLETKQRRLLNKHNVMSLKPFWTKCQKWNNSPSWWKLFYSKCHRFRFYSTRWWIDVFGLNFLESDRRPFIKHRRSHIFNSVHLKPPDGFRLFLGHSNISITSMWERHIHSQTFVSSSRRKTINGKFSFLKYARHWD